jgi:putative ATP-dependent endonuclease of OLD family
MIVKSVHVQNFRSIRDETLLCESLTVLVGPNGSGKSSFLHALEAFYDVSARYTEEDFYAGETSRPISITVTFTDLIEEEKKFFQKYVEGGELAVTKTMGWPPGRGSQRYHGMSLQNPEFDSFRKAAGANLRIEYNELRNRHPELPSYTNQNDATEALKKWEESHPEQCLRQPEEEQFFGFKEVGEAHLEHSTRFLLIPAVRDASEDAAEGRGTVISNIMDLVVRSTLAQRQDVKELQENTQERYDEIMAPEKLVELQSLELDLSKTLQTYVPDAAVTLNWLKGDGMEIPMPRADTKLVEDGYPSSVSHAGHGVQRAFILTMLQHLARAQAPRTESVAESQHAEAKVMLKMPNLILGIEEPELYQHPNRQRHLSEILLKLAMGSIKGVAEQTQIIYSTHSPLLVDVERLDYVRRVRKVLGAQDKPKQTKIFYTTCDDVAKIIEKADSKPEGTYTGEDLSSRLRTLMTPWMNEGFFADVAVLVEGEEDRAMILGVARVMGHNLESMGISVIPCMGKNNLKKATAIFRNLQIRVYTIWDSDYDNEVAKSENNRLLRLLNESTEDWPESVTRGFACFKKNMEATLCDEIGQDFYDRAVRACCERLGLQKTYACKNPTVIEEIIREAQNQNKRSKTLNEIITQVIALKKEEASEG